MKTYNSLTSDETGLHFPAEFTAALVALLKLDIGATMSEIIQLKKIMTASKSDNK